MDIFLAGLNAVNPNILIKNNLKIVGNQLGIQDKYFNLKRNVYVVGFGKAVLGLAINIFNILEDHIIGGVLSVPQPNENDLRKHPNLFRLPDKASSLLEVYYGPRNNLPDKTVLLASRKILDLAKSLTSDDILLTLITGGGSALLCCPANNSINLQDIVYTTEIMAKSGSTIQELNLIRSQLDLLKNGGLAKAAFPSQVISLILSDVIGNDIATIASGPTALSSGSSAKSCLTILQDKNIVDQVPQPVLQFLKEKSEHPPTCNQNSPTYSPSNFIIGSNKTALTSCQRKAQEMGYKCFLLTEALCGNAAVTAESIAELVRLIGNIKDEKNISQLLTVLRCLNISSDAYDDLIDYIRHPHKRSICILFGGETTVKVPNISAASGRRGGRCTHMALSAALYWHKCHHSDLNSSRTTILFGATDGMDGATDGAGAWITPQCITQAQGKYHLNAEEYLSNYDSYSFFQHLSHCGCENGGLIQTGLTGTNVMDIVVVTIEIL